MFKSEAVKAEFNYVLKFPREGNYFAFAAAETVNHLTQTSVVNPCGLVVFIAPQFTVV